MSAFTWQGIRVTYNGKPLRCKQVDVIDGEIAAVYYKDDRNKTQWLHGKDVKVTLSKLNLASPKQVDDLV